jgi:hypothetical protein
MDQYDPKKPMGGLQRETLDIGVRAAMDAGDKGLAVQLARAGRSTVGVMLGRGLTGSGRASMQV